MFNYNENIKYLKKMNDLRRTIIPLMLLGNNEVGKTSIILNMMGNEFNYSQLVTVGKQSYLYKANIKGYDLIIKIWDTAGQERFKSLSVQVIKDCDAVMLVYAVDDKKSFLDLNNWLTRISNISDLSKKPIIIVGNKADIIDKREVKYEEGKKFAEEKGHKFFETSAKTGEGIKEAFNELFDKLFYIYELEITRKTINIGKDKKKQKSFCLK